MKDAFDAINNLLKSKAKGLNGRGRPKTSLTTKSVKVAPNGLGSASISKIKIKSKP